MWYYANSSILYIQIQFASSGSGSHTAHSHNPSHDLNYHLNATQPFQNTWLLFLCLSVFGLISEANISSNQVRNELVTKWPSWELTAELWNKMGLIIDLQPLWERMQQIARITHQTAISIMHVLITIFFKRKGSGYQMVHGDIDWTPLDYDADAC